MKVFILTFSVFLKGIIIVGQVKKTAPDNLVANQRIEVFELRNYVTKPGMQSRFVDYFETNFIDSQNVLGGYILGQHKVKGTDDSFFWIRGFTDMAARSKYLPEFYRGAYWKSHRSNANAMLVNNDNVYLLKPLSFSNTDTAINSNEFGKRKELVVIDFYIANTRLPELIVKTSYLLFLKNSTSTNITLWVSELQENDFPELPVFQDKNLLVTITLYKDEAAYTLAVKNMYAGANKEMQIKLKEIVTTQSTIILYPSKKSFLIQ